MSEHVELHWERREGGLLLTLEPWGMEVGQVTFEGNGSDDEPHRLEVIVFGLMESEDADFNRFFDLNEAKAVAVSRARDYCLKLLEATGGIPASDEIQAQMAELARRVDEGEKVRAEALATIKKLQAEQPVDLVPTDIAAQVWRGLYEDKCKEVEVLEAQARLREAEDKKRARDAREGTWVGPATGVGFGPNRKMKYVNEPMPEGWRLVENSPIFTSNPPQVLIEYVGGV